MDAASYYYQSPKDAANLKTRLDYKVNLPFDVAIDRGGGGVEEEESRRRLLIAGLQQQIPSNSRRLWFLQFAASLIGSGHAGHGHPGPLLGSILAH